jgi:hypothetical protein
MAAITIKDLQAGFDLISDQETYLHELTEGEPGGVKGGLTPIATIVAFSSSVAASYAVSRFIKTFF